MEQYNIFDKIEKKVPYKVPEDFFEKITENTLIKVRKEQKKKQLIRFIIPVAAAASVLLLVATAIYLNQHNPDSKIIISENQIELNTFEIQVDSILETQKNIQETGDKKINNNKLSDPEKKEETESLEDLLTLLSTEELDEMSGIISLEIYSDETNITH